MNRSFKLGVLAASTILGSTLIGHTAAEAAEVDMTCKVDIAKNTIRCGNTLLNMTSDFATLLGTEAMVLADWGTAIGTNANSLGDYATAVGAYAEASKSKATSLGAYAKGWEANSTAVGALAEAHVSGTAVGANAEAIGEFGISLGFNSYSTGKAAMALGGLSLANGSGALGIGYKSIAQGQDSTALGTYAKSDGSNAIAAGAFSLSGSNGSAFGYGSAADISGTAIGYKALAGEGATSVGAHSDASGANSVAIGSASAPGIWSIAIGDAHAQADFSVAIGDTAYAGHLNGVAIGRNAITTAAAQLALGGTGSHVRIGDIAASTTAQDSGTINLATVDASGVMGRSQVSLQQLLNGFGAGAVFDPTYLEDGLADHDVRIGTLETNFGQVLGAMQVLGTKTAEHSDKIDVLTNSMQFFSTEMADLDARVTTLEANAGNGGGGAAFDPTYLEDAIAQYGNRLNAIETLNGEQSDLITGLATASTDHEGRIIQLEGKVANLGPGGGAAYDDSAILAKNAEQDVRLAEVEGKNIQQDARLDGVEAKNAEQDTRLAGVEGKNVEQDERLGEIETKNGEQDTRLAKVETVNKDQDDKIGKIETVNSAQDSKLADHEVRLVKVEDVVLQQKSQSAQMATMQSTLDSHGAAIGTLQGQVGTLFDLAKQNRQGIKAANGGVAMALAMESPAVPAGKSFAISGGVGNFKGQTSLSMALSVAVGEAATVSAGVGYSVNQKDVGTRAGFQIAF